MAGPSRLIQLSRTIATNTQSLDTWFSNSDKQPSFEEHGPLLEEKYPPEIAAAKVAVEDATLELRQLLLGPRKLIHDHLIEHSFSADTICKAGLPKMVPLGGQISYKDLSRTTGIAEIALQKVIRLAITHRLFTEPSPGMVAHTVASRLWATDPHVDDWASYFLEEGVALYPYLWKALERYPNASEPTQTAASLLQAEKTGGQELDTFYSILAKEPHRARRFASVMSSYQKGEGYSVNHAIDGYDWGSLPAGSVVVDLGGSHGDVSVAIAKKFPHLEFVVQDLPETIKSAPQVPDRLPVTFMAHDFFEPQPVKGAKVYLFRWILHNWPEKYCLRILQALIPALEDGSRLLIMDVVVPPVGEIPKTIEKEVRWMDLAMLALFNAGDRQADQWKRVVEKADPRFKYKGIKMIPGSNLSFIEAVWQP
jgi:hypothetical protein